VSNIRVTMYHFLVVVGTFAFWILWQTYHPDDVQTAAVPVTIVATLLSLLWTATAVLKIFKNVE